MTRPISLAALTVLELTPPEMVICAAEAGFSHVGIRLLPATPTEPQYNIIGDVPLLREVERCLADTGVKVLDVEIFRIKPETKVNDYEAAIATAARLGASELLVAGNDPDEARLTERFSVFCDLANRYGLGANLEFMPWTDAKDLKQAARIVERSARINAGVLIDPFHLSRSGSRIDDIAIIPPSSLRFIQFCDVPAAIPASMDAILAEARSERLFPGEGELDLSGLLRALPDNIPISIEVPTHTLAMTVGATERARRALAATKRVLAQSEVSKLS
ncbi:sugar phosphate isomerase/epimerase family protein [Undibacterium sp. SXout7W]|uniref:sugar phosphate isomerase/epimerase family protein n=1 Tax=Undibacterium sp. SXout7W TaxID=3413049 RepID=UPI003BF177A6